MVTNIAYEAISKLRPFRGRFGFIRSYYNHIIVMKYYLIGFVCFIFTILALLIKYKHDSFDSGLKQYRKPYTYTGTEREKEPGSQHQHRNINIIFSENDRKFYPWKDDECKSLATRFAEIGSLEKMALASFPGSGNTWIRYLIEGATGVFTGSVYVDPVLLRRGFYGEERNFADGSTIAQKTHHVWPKLFLLPSHTRKQKQKEQVDQFNGRGVIVVRNPYKALMSFWNLLNTGLNHTATADTASFKSKQFKTFVTSRIVCWTTLVADWIKYGTKIHFIFYEVLKEDPVSEIRKLLIFWGLPANEKRLQCMGKHLVGFFHRTEHQSMNPFTPEMDRIVRRNIDQVNRMIREYSGQQLPLDKYQFYYN